MAKAILEDDGLVAILVAVIEYIWRLVLSNSEVHVWERSQVGFEFSTSQQLRGPCRSCSWNSGGMEENSRRLKFLGFRISEGDDVEV